MTQPKIISPWTGGFQHAGDVIEYKGRIFCMWVENLVGENQAATERVMYRIDDGPAMALTPYGYSSGVFCKEGGILRALLYGFNDCVEFVWNDYYSVWSNTIRRVAPDFWPTGKAIMWNNRALIPGIHITGTSYNPPAYLRSWNYVSWDKHVIDCEPLGDIWGECTAGVSDDGALILLSRYREDCYLSIHRDEEGTGIKAIYFPDMAESKISLLGNIMYYSTTDRQSIQNDFYEDICSSVPGGCVSYPMLCNTSDGRTLMLYSDDGGRGANRNSIKLMEL